MQAPKTSPTKHPQTNSDRLLGSRLRKLDMLAAKSASGPRRASVSIPSIARVARICGFSVRRGQLSRHGYPTSARVAVQGLPPNRRTGGTPVRVGDPAQLSLWTMSGHS